MVCFEMKPASAEVPSVSRRQQMDLMSQQQKSFVWMELYLT